MGRRKDHREKDITRSYLAGELNEDRVDREERFGDRSKKFQERKIEKTARAREDSGQIPDLELLPVGRVIQVYSQYSTVLFEGKPLLCVVRKTLQQRSETGIVVGDLVRLRISTAHSGSVTGGEPEAMIEAVLPRKTVLTRADSFKAIEQHPIVANAEQMLIVASLVQPAIRWGLIDRMVVAARAGNLVPIICVNKIDLNTEEELAEARTITDYYATLDVKSIYTSVERNIGIDAVREILTNRETVLAGHSGVGKSSLIRAIEPSLDIRVGEISTIHNKGKHTTTSAKIYPLSFGGSVIDTPGVKLFGLWQISEENILEFFPDIESESAPDWRKDSFQRILESLGVRR